MPEQKVHVNTKSNVENMGTLIVDAWCLKISASTALLGHFGIVLGRNMKGAYLG